MRLLEPLGAIEEEPAGAGVEPEQKRDVQTPGIAIALQDVGVRAAGHVILQEVNLTIASGEHVAIVGSSGAGKSSLVGLLLGWHRAAAGSVLIDGVPLESNHLEGLRRQIAWIDPAVQLWNRSFTDNLCYGADSELAMSIGAAIQAADLRRVLEQLPDGLQTPLGEGGALVSGGEGQRVRLARAMLRPGVRLAILDEPFRGLDRERRRELLKRARKLWMDATLLCITHDVSETKIFPRVVVIEQGRVVEDGPPLELMLDAGSRYRALLEAEEAVMRGLWSKKEWRRLWLEGGQLTERSHAEKTAV